MGHNNIGCDSNLSIKLLFEKGVTPLMVAAEKNDRMCYKSTCKHNAPKNIMSYNSKISKCH